MSCSALALRHVMFEDAGLLAPVLEARGISLDYAEVPSADLAQLDMMTPDLLVVLGGPVGVYEEEDYPWLERETALIAARLAARKPTLGICLGAQLMAKALGARVYPGAEKEIGWAPIRLTAAGAGSPLAHAGEGGAPVLHWHGDICDLPEGAERLAFTPACPNQAFSAGSHALGLQFHLEAYGAALEHWFVGHTAEIAAAPGVSVSRLRQDTQLYSADLAARGARVFHAWLDAAGL